MKDFILVMTYKGFSFENEKLDDENLRIRFDYQSSNYRDVLFGLRPDTLTIQKSTICET